MDLKAVQYADVFSVTPDFSIKESQGILSSVSKETEDKSEASDLKECNFFNEKEKFRFDRFKSHVSPNRQSNFCILS